MDGHLDASLFSHVKPLNFNFICFEEAFIVDLSTSSMKLAAAAVFSGRNFPMMVRRILNALCGFLFSSSQVASTNKKEGTGGRKGSFY
jgi:hypothetical protein